MHPVLGPVPPARFIPLAEEARLIGPIGDWVLRNACVEAMRWPDDITVAVNISPEQLRDPAFLETVISALAHSGLSSNRLTMEVTETLFMRERTGAIQLLDKLMALGVGLALDDFGTGRSSIGFFSRTRFGSIKIDRAFVAGAARGQRESVAIVRAAVAMAESLEVDAVAEGVESMFEYDRMRALGFTKVQGYHLGRPMPASEAYKLVNAGRSNSAVA
jgi:EAL domain-containing protein (putative c-di-GMP-specific phosphodiesterase class I)